MPRIPDRHDLGPIRVNGRANPAQINPSVAYDIGRAGAAMDRAMSEVGAAFAGLGAKQQAMDDANWLADAKIKTLEADDAIRRDTELNAGEDGAGFEQAPMRLKGTIDEVAKKPGGSAEARSKYNLWAAEQGYETGRWAANTAQSRLKESTLTKLDSRLDTLSGLASSNPERAEQYLSAYEEEINSYVGSAISTTDASKRIEQARSNIGKASIITRAIKNPSDFGKALKAVESATPAEPDANLNAADQTLKLTPQERALYQRHLTNLRGPGGVDNPDGSRSTLYQTTIEVDGRFYNIPTVWDGKILSMNDPKEKEQIKQNIKKSGGLDAFPSYATESEAEQRYQQMHSYMERDTGTFLNQRKRGSALKAASSDGAASVSYQLETGTNDPMKGVKSVRRDAGGTKSYGNFGLNTGGSLQEFVTEYGSQFDLTARPGSRQFDQQWKNAAGAAPVELHAAEMAWWEKTIGSKVVNNLTRVGVASDVANDPRVKAYFADRSVQYGPGAIANHAARVKTAYEASGGDVEKFLTGMNKADKEHLAGDFRTAIASGDYGPRGHNTRLSGRLSRSLAVAGEGPPAEVQPSVDVGALPKVDGTIQPSELMKLSLEDRNAVIKGLAPSLQVEMQDRMNRALAAVASKGFQNIITNQEIDDSAPLIGVKNAAKWKEQLGEAGLFYSTTNEAKGMSRQERIAHLNELVPSGNPEDLAGAERQKFDIWAGTIQRIDKALKEDPLRYVSSENESGRQAMKVIAGADAGPDGLPAREKAYTTLIELQKREGVSDANIRLLSPEQATATVDRFNEAKTGPAKAQVIDGLRQSFGAHMNRVWGQLVNEGMQNSFLSMGTATERGQDALVQAYAVEKTLNEGAGKDESRKGALRSKAHVDKDFDTAISSALSEFNSGIPFAHERLRQGYREAVEMVSMYYMVNQGKDQSTAIAQAYKDVVGDKVETFKGVNIPRDVSNFYGSDLKLGLHRNYKSLIARDEPNIASNIELRPDRNFADERRSYLDYVIGTGKFMTNSDGTGVWLLDSSGRKVQKFVDQRKDDRTEALFYTWEDLAKAHELPRGNPLFGGRMFSDPFRE